MALIMRNTGIGKVFSGKPKLVSWPRLWTFSGGPFKQEGWPAKNIHTDLEFARSCGLPDKVAASATQYQGYAIQLLIDLFGPQWLYHGVMDVRFIAIVNAGDTLVAKAAVKSKEDRGESTRFLLDVYCENQRGEKVLVGQSSCYAGKVKPQGLEEFEKARAALLADSSIQRSSNEEVVRLEPLEYVVSPELNQQFCYGQDDFHARYIEETEIGLPVAHPALLLNWSNGTRSPTYRIASGQAGIHAREHTFFFNPARVGKKIKVTWKGIGTYERRGRPYSVGETLVVDEDGLEIIRRLHYSTIASQEHRVKVEGA